MSNVSAEQTVRHPYERLRGATRAHPVRSLAQRRASLGALARVVHARRYAMADAISADFGNRSQHESLIGEIFIILEGIKYAKSHLAKWMKPRRRHISLTFKPATAKVHYQALGVVGIMSPWNYPAQLALAPLTAALSAGNRVLLKPSELAPRTAELLAEMMTDAFPPDEVAVVNGGVDIGEAFSHLPLDHLFYTGSTQVGRLIMKAASENLTPVTLELGGKSPTLVHPDYPSARAAERVANGKWFNAGQTCIAPDYVFVHASRESEFIDALKEAVATFYPTLAHNPDYTSIINPRHHKRLESYLDDAREQGAEILELNPSSESFEDADGRMPPTLVRGVTDRMLLMQNEIFGPILPILTYEEVDEALAYINARPRPLALYIFDNDRARVRHVLDHTVSGGVCVNDTILHVAQDDLPFGGVGDSGMGAYHGKEGFETFSHARGVMVQGRLNAAGLLAPPYGKTMDRLIRLLIG